MAAACCCVAKAASIPLGYGGMLFPKKSGGLVAARPPRPRARAPGALLANLRPEPRPEVRPEPRPAAWPPAERPLPLPEPARPAEARPAEARPPCLAEIFASSPIGQVAVAQSMSCTDSTDTF
jgi:hypothetical protein